MWQPPAKEIVRPPLHYAPAQVSGPVCVAASCTRNNKALKKIFSAPSAQKVKNFLRASREKEISFLGGGESLEVLVIFVFEIIACFQHPDRLKISQRVALDLLDT